MNRAIAPLALLLLLPLALGCGGEAAEEVAEASDAAQAAAVSAGTPELPDAPSSAPLTVADIDRWERGMAGELTAVRESQARLAAAPSADDSATAIYAGDEMSTLAAGAAAAGLSEERYQFVRSTLARASAFLAPDEMPGLPAAMAEEARQGRERALAGMSAELPPGVLEALRPRAAALRQRNLSLTVERLRLAGG